MQYKYYITSISETPQDVTEFESRWELGEDDTYLAEDAAKHFYDWRHTDRLSWPLTFVILNMENIELGRFSIDLEYEPFFRASELSA